MANWRANWRRRGHRGPYLGVDFSLPLLKNAEPQPAGFSASFIEVDLTQLSNIKDRLSSPHGWSLITAFAVLHHIPSSEIRLDILRTVHDVVSENGKFILSNWQFLNSEKLRSRIQDWSKVGLSNADVDPGDYSARLAEWGRGPALCASF